MLILRIACPAHDMLNLSRRVNTHNEQHRVQITKHIVQYSSGEKPTFKPCLPCTPTLRAFVEYVEQGATYTRGRGGIKLFVKH